MPTLELTGQKFGKLLVVAFACRDVSKKRSRRYWTCRCDCGRTVQIETSNLRTGNSTACGSCRTASPTSFAPVHGASTEKGPTYNTWRAMRRRVRQRPEYKGVDIDPSWDRFEVFLADMGERPKGMTIDRIDGTKGYSKANCRWATPLQQTRNRRIALLFTWEGRTMPIMEWAKEMGVSYGSMAYRIGKYGSVRLPDAVRIRTLVAR